jgi:XTP/dITP diphosphohydrolase
VLYLAATMARLRAPGGCPWDAEQTHDSLVQYLLEESYETAEAIETGSREDLREELGDVLLQVVFHSLIAAEHRDDPFDLDEIAQGTANKLIRRHPHVFTASDSINPNNSNEQAMSAEESHRRWDQIKTDEKSRVSALDGIPVAQSALARAQKVLGRARRVGLKLTIGSHQNDAGAEGSDGAGLGERLLLLASEADARGLDAEKELRSATRRVEKLIKELEAAGDPGGAKPESVRTK